MELKPYFSIITASFNNFATIEKTLKSVKAQNFKNFEHIVIDGGSSDNTVNVLAQYQNIYNLKWISKPDDGIADALNKGVEVSKGKYIIVIQADDYLLRPDTLLKVYKKLKSNPCDIFSCPVVVDHPKKGRYLFKPVKILWWHHFKTIFPHQGCFVARQVFERTGEFNKNLSIGMDYDFFYRALKHKIVVCFGREIIAVMGGQGISTGVQMLRHRLKEELHIQQINETNRAWKLAQAVFHFFYIPYKLKIHHEKNN